MNAHSHSPASAEIGHFIALVESALLPHWQLQSTDEHEPVEVAALPAPWQLLGCGNYAAVVCHPDHPGLVVKRYAPGRPGLAEEAGVYARLGDHPAYSAALHVGADYLILRRIYGKTLWQCCLDGTPITRQCIADIDAAMAWAAERQLNPHDVHAKNVMQHEGRGYIVDISDFYKTGPCQRWSDFRKVYDYLYAPLLLDDPVPLPLWLMNGLRRCYRKLRKILAQAGNWDSIHSK
ncbi:hypothetical protein [Chitinilyticum aquatile]|uniref:hypothetical protein n=1 Tax=Chitinilyticum aquatile TaxID=362520 RepID=UPI000687FC50|nr:hypothetical protein [Chitinilyticum aquatile]